MTDCKQDIAKKMQEIADITKGYTDANLQKDYIAQHIEQDLRVIRGNIDEIEKIVKYNQLVAPPIMTKDNQSVAQTKMIKVKNFGRIYLCQYTREQFLWLKHNRPQHSLFLIDGDTTFLASINLCELVED